MFDQFSQFKEGALRHLDEAAAFAHELRRDTIARQIEEGRRQLAESRYNIAIVGDMNRGKSTLLNTLLGRADDHLSPIQAKVCTSAIVHYLSREAQPEGRSEAKVFFDDGQLPKTIAVESLRDFITEERNPKNEKKVRTVDVFGEFPLLRNVVTLVDTPGRGAVQRHHEILVEQFMPFADAIIFLIASDLPITASEYEFLNQLGKQEKDRIFFVLTKRDEVEDKDIGEVRRYVRDQISKANLTCDHLFEVSARPVYEAVRDGLDPARIQELRRENGISELEESLEQFIIQNSSKNVTMLPRLKSLLEFVEGFYQAANSEIAGELGLLTEGGDQITEEIKHLKSSSKEMKHECERSLKKFETNWAKSVDGFCRKLEGRGDFISTRILDKMKRGGLLGSASGALKAARLVEGAVGTELQALLPDLDEKLSEHAQTLSDDIESDWGTHFRVRAQRDLVLPSISLLGLGGSGIAAAVGVSQVFAAVSAWTAVGGAAAAQGGAVAFWTSIVGGGTVSSATTIAIAATPPALIGVVATFAVAWVAKEIILAVQDGRVPELVSKSIEEMNAKIPQEMKRRSVEIAESFRSSIDEKIDSDMERLRVLEKSVRESDPKVRVQLEQREKTCRNLLTERQDLGHSMKLLLYSLPNDG